MRTGDMLILKGSEVISLLDGREGEVLKAVQRAYEAHAAADSVLPHSTFLRFPGEPRNRIIALPAYLGQDFELAGIKWVSSFPANTDVGLDRASAVVIVNSTRTGLPEVIIEGSVISAQRTAASAALAAQQLQSRSKATCAGLIGCGLINFEIARFLLAACPEIDSFLLFDRHKSNAEQFQEQLRQAFGIQARIAADPESALRACSLISLATTAIEPHISDLSMCIPGSTILHISLRDLTPEVILSCDNVVDDVDHVCRAQTSVHLAEQLVGSRDFIRCSLADITLGNAPARRAANDIVVFSPFGLGVLDLAVAKLVTNAAREEGVGTVISSFLPPPRHERNQGRARVAAAQFPRVALP
jgi:2,3-diaminopropionate biosynthesis protein SbnB